MGFSSKAPGSPVNILWRRLDPIRWANSQADCQRDYPYPWLRLPLRHNTRRHIGRSAPGNSTKARPPVNKYERAIAHPHGCRRFDELRHCGDRCSCPTLKLAAKGNLNQNRRKRSPLDCLSTMKSKRDQGLAHPPLSRYYPLSRGGRKKISHFPVPPLIQDTMLDMKIDKFLFDLDGTITREELLPRIAQAGGVAGEIAELTRKTIAGEIPFASSFRRRVQILSSIPVSLVREVAAGVSLDPHIMRFIDANRERCVIVTGNLDIWIEDLVELIGLPAISSRATAIGDKIVELTHILDKERTCEAFDLPFCAVGDGNNDRGMLSRATIGVAFGGVHPPARSLYEVATHAVFEAKTLCALLSQW